jgi:hypothetical protein
MTVLYGRKAGNSLIYLAAFILVAGTMAVGTGLISGCGKNVHADSTAGPPAMKATVVRVAQSGLSGQEPPRRIYSD